MASIRREFGIILILVKTERESEKLTGVRLSSVISRWDWRGSLGEQLLVPQLQLKFTNISNSPIERLIIKADFINVSTNEIFGDAFSYVVSSGDTPLQPGYTKTAFLYSNVGYKDDSVALNFPNLVADIYINDKFYRKIKISKKYAGMDWNR